MKKFICIHGHFYQPPRENPWLEEVEQQDSASPYHDWNDRITDECYGPNSASRRLDENGRINQLVNNYANISFNFGPTLLSWMEKSAPEVYQSILEADVVSQKKFSGHGSAMAQVYNHIIMPLANSKDKETQIVWGIKDFEYRFRRKPKGMWLAETAVDTESLELLAQNGIEFTILAPKQASKIKRIKDHSWTEISEEKLDTRKPYLCNLPSGRKIILFFYNGAISHDIAFEGLLKNGEKFSERLLSAFSLQSDEVELVHVATDGETYGHHHRFGDMALTYCLSEIEKKNSAKITCYAEFISTTKIDYEVQIHENSAWSCAHGVQRWRSNCGCRFNHMTQQEWRRYLREALNGLRDYSTGVFLTAVKELLKDPWEARNSYIDVLLTQKYELFFKSHEKRYLDQNERSVVLKALEMQRYSLLMFTSCAWFFDDISGIETIQILQYASRVLQLAKELSGTNFEKNFLEVLKRAKSNISDMGTGFDIYEKFVKPHEVDLNRVAIQYSINSIFKNYTHEVDFKMYGVKSQNYEKMTSGEQTLVLGRAFFESKSTKESRDLAFAALHMGNHNFICGAGRVQGQDSFLHMKKSLAEYFNKGDVTQIIRWIDQHFGSFGLAQLFKDDQIYIMQTLRERALEETLGFLRQLYRQHYTLMQGHISLNLPIPKYFLSIGEFLTSVDITRTLRSQKIDFVTLNNQIDEALKMKISFEGSSLQLFVQHKLLHNMKDWADDPLNMTALENVVQILTAFKKLKLNINIWKLQNLYFEVWKQQWPVMIKNKEKIGNFAQWQDLLRKAANILDIKVE